MKNNKNNIIIVIIIVAIVAIISITAYLFIDKYNNRKIEMSQNEIEDYLDINVASVEAETVEYFVEQKDVVGATYDKGEMTYTLKSSKNPQKNLVNPEHNWGSNILMYCDVEDNKQIQVISSLDEDDLSVMKAEWQDNGLYYGMYTENLTTREEFLLEVNKVVLDNHKRTSE